MKLNMHGGLTLKLRDVQSRWGKIQAVGSSKIYIYIYKGNNSVLDKWLGNVLCSECHF